MRNPPGNTRGGACMSIEWRTICFSLFLDCMCWRPQIFDYLEENIAHNLRERGEFQLTPCLDTLRKEDNFSGYVLKGRRFDIGLPEAYRETVIDFRNA